MTRINSRPTGTAQIENMIWTLKLAIKGVKDLNSPIFVNKDEIGEEVEERIKSVITTLNAALKASKA